jgi:hypothetical protein
LNVVELSVLLGETENVEVTNYKVERELEKETHLLAGKKSNSH